jgi:hypothetical protein
LELILQEPGKKPDHSNLLDWTGNLHGYQPYDFGAWDFVNGAQKSSYGQSRVIKLRKLGMEMHVKVIKVHVEPTSADSSQEPNYQFNDLTLEITTQSLAKGGSN